MDDDRMNDLPFLEWNSTTSNRKAKLYITEVALYRDLTDDIPLRSIRFKPGLNIVQGIDLLENETGKSRRGVGHGVGKTLLCRLIRFAFGERTFGKGQAMREVCTNFPNGFVGVSVAINGEDWTIVRSFVPGLYHVAQGFDFCTVARSDGPASNPKKFLDVLASLFIDPEISELPAEWPALLAWCSRDQEARHKQLLQWRIPDSQSQVAVEKDDALCTVRSVLKIGSHMRLKEKERASAKACLEYTEHRIKEVRSELQQQLEREVRTAEILLPNIEGAATSDSDIFNVEDSAYSRQKEIDLELSELELVLSELDREIEQSKERHRRISDRLRNLTEAVQSVRAKSAMFSEPSDDGINPALDCDYGQVKFEACEHRKAYIARLRQDAERRSLGQTDLDSELAKAEEDIHEFQRQRAGEEVTLQTLRSRLGKAYQDQAHLQSEHLHVGQLVERYGKLQHRLNAQSEDPELDTLLRNQERYKNQIEELTAELDSLIQDQSNQLEKLNALLNWLAKQIIGDEISCRLSVSSTAVDIALIEGDGGEAGGEHYSTTMKVLLFDLMAMLSGATRLTLHPGVLLHDSPKEAEMQDSLFSAMLSLLANLTSPEPELTPFQYIIVTSASIPEDLTRFSNEMLWRGGDGSGYLFKQRLTIPKTTLMLEDS